MSEQRPAAGTIAWSDLTVADADRIRDFYASVAGWRAEPVDMGGYSDYCMMPAGSPAAGPAAGICHARGVNADLPAAWLVYIVVDDVDRSVAECLRLGGSVIRPAARSGGGTMAVIRDPAGAVCALYKPS